LRGGAGRGAGAPAVRCRPGVGYRRALADLASRLQINRGTVSQIAVDDDWSALRLKRL
jgi:hypothetical protein